MDIYNDMTQARVNAARAANDEDAAIWRWFSSLLEERRIRWCVSGESWFVSVDNRHVSTEQSFDSAIRVAKDNLDLAIAQRNVRRMA
ncbi:hypothetical protein [Burkholderia sp. BCC1993]|uniref:hypothetical protein n=1 Tax=Burkholderia sp. BCC1993 TaxID=2817444 RepID=UPI002AB09691|nr:hypothetical protein [Burkholderia sp. BCC1993]